uniref:Sushi domain-containing protein n=1 Tax=Chrysemys picta bellii TaxID=8478 RepID=A0A8C3PCE8_CHRPI
PSNDTSPAPARLRLRPFPAWPRPLKSVSFLADLLPPCFCLSLWLGQCGSPPRLSFAEVTGKKWSRYLVGYTLSYSCRPGYTLDPRKSPRSTQPAPWHRNHHCGVSASQGPTLLGCRT